MPGLLYQRPASFSPLYPVQYTVEQVPYTEREREGTHSRAANTSSSRPVSYGRKGWGGILQRPWPLKPHMLIRRYNDRSCLRFSSGISNIHESAFSQEVWPVWLQLRQQVVPASVPEPDSLQHLPDWQLGLASQPSQTDLSTCQVFTQAKRSLNLDPKSADTILGYDFTSHTCCQFCLDLQQEGDSFTLICCLIGLLSEF